MLHTFKKILEIKEQYLLLRIFDIFQNFFVIKFYHEKALIKWTKTHKSKLEENKLLSSNV